MPFVNRLREFDDDIERAYTIAINKEEGSLFEYPSHRILVTSVMSKVAFFLFFS